MVESQCPTCSSPVLPGQAYCANCGAALAGGQARSDGAASGAPKTEFGPAAEPEPHEGPSLATAGPREDPSLDAEPEPAESPAERVPGGYVPPSPGLEPSAWAMSPSSSGSSPRTPWSSIGRQVGATPMSLAGRPQGAETPPAEPFAAPQVEPVAQLPVEEPVTAPAVVAWASPGTVPAPEDVSPQPSPGASHAGPPPPPVPPVRPETTPTPSYVVQRPPAPPSPFAQPAPFVPSAPVPPAVPAGEAGDRPARKESIQELVAFGLVAAGSVIGILSLFLPWSGITGIGIGTESIAGSPPPPNQWGWGMPAGFLLFLLSLPVLVAAAGSDRAQERLPKAALVISRVTDLILPMILGGLYLGVVFMYMTVPAGYGPGLYTGQFALVLGAGLLIAGAIVTIFFPPEADSDAD